MKNLLLLFLVWACQTSDPVALGYEEYANIGTQHEWIYEYQKQTYQVGEEVLVETKLLKEIIEDNDTQLKAYSKPLSGGYWQLDSVVNLKANGLYFTKMEGGKSIQKLEYPLADQRTFNVNAHNSEKEHLAKIWQFSTTKFQNFNISFDKSPIFMIDIKSDSSLIGVNRYQEYYAHNLGLIYLENKNIAFCQNTECIGKFIPESGFFIKKKLLSFTDL